MSSPATKLQAGTTQVRGQGVAFFPRPGGHNSPGKARSHNVANPPPSMFGYAIADDQRNAPPMPFSVGDAPA